MMVPLSAMAVAAWLGIVTSISPCPLASNIAAMSYIAKRMSSARHVVLSGLLYTAGRSLGYVLLAALIIAGLLSVPQVSDFLQRYLNRLLGPLLIVVGMFMLELLSVGGSGRGVSESLQRRVDRGGPWAAGLLGLVFALSLCPLSAAMFFGGLIPLAAQHQSRFVLPLVYGVGTALPVALFGLLLAAGARSIGAVFHKVQAFELWARRITGAVFILVGIYYSLVYDFGVF